MAFILPSDKDTAALEENTSWRFMFGLPLAMYGLMLVGFATFVRYDSPKFYMSADDNENALKSINTIYKTNGD